MSTDAVIARLASESHQILSRDQLDAELTPREINRRVADGLLLPSHRGVYRHAAVNESVESRLMAAVVAAGPGAVASHRSAARMWGLRDVPRWAPEVTVPGSRLPRMRNVVLHRTDLLETIDVTVRGGIPVTTVARTLLDCGAVLPAWVVASAAQDAIITRLATHIDLVCVLERVGRRGRRGTAALRSAVLAGLPPEEIESRLELALLRLVRSCPVAPPAIQHEVVLRDGKRVRLDLAWPGMGVAVEADGRRWHSTSKDFERDLARSNAIVDAGWRLYRFGWVDVHQRRATVRSAITRAVGKIAAA